MSPRSRTGLLVFSVAGALFLVVSVAIVLAAPKGAGKPGSREAGQASDGPFVKKMRTRVDFDQLIIGKSQTEVIKLLGKPHSTSRDSWTYQNVTHDPIASKDDWFTTLYFDNGYVDHIHY